MRRPRFRSPLRVRVIPPDLLIIEDESGHEAMQGKAFPLLAPLIDGERTVADIAGELDGKVPLLDVRFGLSLLEDNGHVVEADDALPADRQLLGDLLGISPAEHRRRLADHAVRVCSAGEHAGAADDARVLSGMLESMGVRLSPAGSFQVVVTGDYLDRKMDAINREALADGRPWMLVRPRGAVLWMGPLFRPGESACWSCLARRLQQNRPLDEFVAAQGGYDLHLPRQQTGASMPLAAGSAAATGPVTHAALGLAATQTLHWLVRGRGPDLEGRMLSLDLRTMRMDRHPVIRLPDCEVCGEDTDQHNKAGRRLVLASRPKLFFTDGGHRTVLPEDTLEHHAHLISPLTGIVDSIRRVHRDDFTQLYVTGYSFPAHLQDRSFLDKDLRARSTGKGMHAAQARASALCEAVERYSGLFRGDEPRQRSSFRSLGETAIDPASCMLISADQYGKREEWNRHNRDFNWIPRPFDETREIDWTAIWSLSAERVRYVPAAYCYFGYPNDRDLFSRADSNGNSAGNTIEEAILQGLMEIVERDCVAIWWYNRLRRPAVDLASFGQPFFTAVERHYRDLGREIWVLDLTGDAGIPAFAAISLGSGKSEVEDLVMGFGAHLDPTVGVSRALTEMNQFLPAARKGRPLRMVNRPVMAEPFLQPATDLDTVRRQDHASTWTGDLRDDIGHCVGRLADLGLEILVLDQTRADAGMPVVKVIVPQMRPFWARFAPGRLFDVPLSLGWTTEPVAEADLNPAHLII